MSDISSITKSGLTVLIPAFNEEQSIANTLQTILRVVQQLSAFEIIVIDDGSQDKTRDIAKALSVVVIENETNLGYGASLKRGLLQARYDWVLIADADGTYPLEDIPKLLQDKESYAMVVGARIGDVVQVPLLRRPGKWLITRLAEYLSSQKIPDLNSGFRLFRKEVAMRFFTLFPEGFSFTTTLTLALLTNHYRVKFVPINYHKRVGTSTIHPIRDFINFTILIIRICAYFKPLNVFMPPALLLILLGFIKGVIDYTGQGHLGLLSITMGLTGIQMIFIGLLADLIDRRMKL